MKSTLAILILLTFSGLSHADFIVAQTGDSVGNNAINRVNSTGIVWIGDHNNPPTFAQSGWGYFAMKNGKNGIDGMVDHVQNYAAPDFAYILGGYNDVVLEVNNSDMTFSMGRLKDLIVTIQTGWNVPVVVANVTQFPADRQWAHKQSNVLTLNALISDYADSHAGVYLLDNYSIITPDLIRADGLHLNNAGQAVVGQHFSNFLQTIPEPTCPISLVLLTFIRRRRYQRN